MPLSFWEQRAVLLYRISDFKTDIWKTLSNKERVQRIQSLENFMAQKKSRTPRVIKTLSSAEMEERFGYVPNGYYLDSDPTVIYMNNDNIGGFEMDENGLYADGKYSSYWVMHTTIHEGEHSTQYDLIYDRPSPNSNSCDIEGYTAKQVKNFEKNSLNYVEYPEDKNDMHGKIKYLYQPMEDDANAVADQQMKDFESLFYDDTEYSQYIKAMEQVNDNNEEAAVKEYDGNKNFRDEIANEINENAEASSKESELNTIEPDKKFDASDNNQQELDNDYYYGMGY